MLDDSIRSYRMRRCDSPVMDHPVRFLRPLWRNRTSALNLFSMLSGKAKRVGYYDESFDREFGTDTAKPERLNRLSIDSPNYLHGVRYQASVPATCERAIRYLKIRNAELILNDASEYPSRVSRWLLTCLIREGHGLPSGPTCTSVFLVPVRTFAA
jgi:hypothetical protein